jgi:negative regulator of flagellin synthesis FlgM
MEIFGAGGTQGPQAVYPRLASFTVEAGEASPLQPSRDRVEISPIGRMLEGVAQMPEIRHEKVEAIRQQIASGVYETPEKLEIALDRLMEEATGW